MFPIFVYNHGFDICFFPKKKLLVLINVKKEKKLEICRMWAHDFWLFHTHW